MKTVSIDADSALLPDYVIACLERLPWMKKEGRIIEFHPDDFIVILYGVRGSTAFSGPDHVRYGSNTTAYQVWSPKLPLEIMYLGDGGSGVLEADKVIMSRLLSHGVNPFTATVQEAKPYVSGIMNTYTHYHYDHLHMGAPLSGMFNANSIPKTIIGGDNPKSQFAKAFKRPSFPRDFGEIQASYTFHNIDEPRSAVLIFLPSGEYRVMGTSDFNRFLEVGKPQIKHNKMFFDLEDCLVVRCYASDHPDSCISYRYENYDGSGKLLNSFVFMTDHEIRETDDRNPYFHAHVAKADAIYLDGQYSNDNFIPGFGHGRVEVIGEIAAKLNLENVIVGHHDPKRTDREIDDMIERARKRYSEVKPDGTYRIVGGSDRMMLFIPGKDRGRSGMVYGRMDLDLGESDVVDSIGSSSTVVPKYHEFDLTKSYRVEDYTASR